MISDVKYKKLLKRIKELESDVEDNNIELLKHRRVLLRIGGRKEEAEQIVIPKKKHKK